MDEPEVVASFPETTRVPKRRRRILLRGAIVVVGCMAALIFCAMWISDRSLQRAMAETDRLDPGWRMEELEAKRAFVPDEENSGLVVAAVVPLMPPGWPGWDVNPPNSKPNVKDAQAMQKLVGGLSKSEMLSDPCILWDARYVTILREEITRAEPALAEAHKVLGRARGRYPITYMPDPFSMRLPQLQDARKCKDLLACEATLRALDQDTEGAITCCRAIVSVSRSLGDEPPLISMLVRMAIRQAALQRIEQTLALGQPKSDTLAALQQLLEEDEKEPLFLVGMRGERAGMDGLMQAIQQGDISASRAIRQLGVQGFMLDVPDGLLGFEAVIVSGSFKSQRAALLRFNNRLVEIAKLPVEDQAAPLAEMKRLANDLPVLGSNFAPQCINVGENWIGFQASLRCAIALLAVERYRQAHGHWPRSLSDLVPDYLAKVPIDPYDAAPLRFRSFVDGVVVYSVGADREDNGGKFDRNPQAKGSDRGFRLWDVARRRQPPRLP